MDNITLAFRFQFAQVFFCFIWYFDRFMRINCFYLLLIWYKIIWGRSCSKNYLKVFEWVTKKKVNNLRIELPSIVLFSWVMNYFIIQFRMKQFFIIESSQWDVLKSKVNIISHSDTSYFLFIRSYERFFSPITLWLFFVLFYVNSLTVR